MNASLVILLGAGFYPVLGHRVDGWIKRMVGPSFRSAPSPSILSARSRWGSSPVGLRAGDWRHRTCAYS